MSGLAAVLAVALAAASLHADTHPRQSRPGGGGLAASCPAGTYLMARFNYTMRTSGSTGATTDILVCEDLTTGNGTLHFVATTADQRAAGVGTWPLALGKSVYRITTDNDTACKFLPSFFSLYSPLMPSCSQATTKPELTGSHPNITADHHRQPHRQPRCQPTAHLTAKLPVNPSANQTQHSIDTPCPQRRSTTMPAE